MDGERRFESLLGDTEAYASGEEIGGRFGRIKRVARRGVRLASPVAKLAAKGIAAATGPIRRRIFRAFFGKLVNRRARLLAWQGRHSLQPSIAEKQAAQSWAKAYVKRKGVLGKLVGATLAGEMGAEPVTASILAMSIPALIKLARRALRTAEKEGAPSDPSAEREEPSS